MKSYIKCNQICFTIYQILHQTHLKEVDLSQRDHDTLKSTTLDLLQPNGTRLYTALKGLCLHKIQIQFSTVHLLDEFQKPSQLDGHGPQPLAIR